MLYKKIGGYASPLTLIVLTFILIISILTLLIYIFTTGNNENFICEESSSEQVIQKGMGGVAQTGTITFSKVFNNVPLVYTQVIGNSIEPNIIYGVNIYNITQSGFSYSKNKLVTETSEDLSMTNVMPSTTEQFQWLAFG